MDNVITFTRFWYLIKRTTNSRGIRANWINCLLYKVLLNLHIFPVLNKNCTEPYLGPLRRSFIYIFLYWQKSSFTVLSVNSLKEFSSLEQFQYVKGFQMFHTGVKLSRLCGLSLLSIFTFWVFTLWHITLVLYSKRKSSITAPPPLTTKLISKPHGLQVSETRPTKSVLVFLRIVRIERSLLLAARKGSRTSWWRISSWNKANLVLGTFSSPLLSWLLALPNVVFKVSKCNVNVVDVQLVKSV